MESMPEDIKTIGDAIDYAVQHGVQPARWRFQGNPWMPYRADADVTQMTEVEFADRSRFHHSAGFTKAPIIHRHVNINNGA